MHPHGARARLSELRIHRARAEAKLQKAQRIATLRDITLFKQWWAGEASSAAPSRIAVSAPSSLLRCMLISILLDRYGNFPWCIFELLCELCGTPSGCHPEQLHLEEYAAHECLPVITNIACQQVASQKPFTAPIHRHVDDDVEGDKDLLGASEEITKHHEVLGGEGEGATEDEDTGAGGYRRLHSPVPFSLPTYKAFCAEMNNQPGLSQKADTEKVMCA